MAYENSKNHTSDEYDDCLEALKSCKGEYDALEGYAKSMSCVHDDSLKAVLRHIYDEEVEHVALLEEYLIRHCPGWEKLR